MVDVCDDDLPIHREFRIWPDRRVTILPIATLWHRLRAHDFERMDEVRNDLLAAFPVPDHVADLVRDRKTAGIGCVAAAQWFKRECKHDNAYSLYRAWVAMGASESTAMRWALVAMLIQKYRESRSEIKRTVLRVRMVALAAKFQTHFDLEDVAELYLKARLALDDGQPEKNYRYHLVVCRSAALVHGDRDLKELLSGFKRLERPIELRVPPANWEHKLKAEYPWLQDVIERVVADQRIRSRGVSPWISIRPILLVGPPGIGKSRFARALADAMNLPFQGHSFAGQSDARALLGTARGWSTAVPSAIVELLRKSCCANPLVFVDEIEKAEKSHNGDPRAALLAMMEPTTNCRWEDPCLRREVDLSAVCWVAGANSLDRLETPLLSRFQIFHVRAPGAEHWLALKETMLTDIAWAAGISRDAIPRLDPAVEQGMCNLLDACGDLRRLRRVLEQIVEIGIRERESALI